MINSSIAGLVTRMTTDVTNVQNAYQMIIRIAVRAPLMMICSITNVRNNKSEIKSYIFVALIFWDLYISLLYIK